MGLTRGCSKCCCSCTACAVSSAPSEFKGFFLCPNPPGLPMVTQNTVLTLITQNVSGTRSSIPDSCTQPLHWILVGISHSRFPGTNFDPTPSLPHLGAISVTSSWTCLSHTHIYSQEMLLLPPTIKSQDLPTCPSMAPPGPGPSQQPPGLPAPHSTSTICPLNKARGTL